ncbi:MAG: Na/Pi cotransporter family protein [Lachnospiraceae bacterium]|nr:Na/Pi cotransporter family protein [Lachnospiraceae bacterium]
MDFFDFLTMIGGLALFLYGMHLLGEGLAKVAGGKFEQILERLTDNPVKAVFMGAGVTAVIQSSSAATVMVVGFVNSGIMKLQQAVGIIMGANVGTTITSWILGAQGIDSNSFLVRMCKPASFSPILAIIGVVLISVTGRGGAAQRDRKKSIGVILIGFAILMFGMDTMSGAVKPLADVPEFTGLLTRFTNPFLGVLAGTALTAVLQSSSASVGILQALCATGAVGYGAAIPIIMGQNIGTCATAMLSGMGAGKNAKRAALVHLYFNVIGTLLFMAFFYLLNMVRPFAFLDMAATPFGIAAVHSVFNILSTLVLLPFSGGLVKLACLSVREADSSEEEENVLQLLDVRFLEMPSYAVERSRTVAGIMAEQAQKAMNLAMGLLRSYTKEAADEVEALECSVDAMEDALGEYLVKLSAKDMPEKDSHVLSTILHCIGDFERISDHARNVKESVEDMVEKGMQFSDKAGEELDIVSKAVCDILDLAMRSFREGNLQLARQVEPLEEVIDGLNLDVRRRHVKRLRKGKCTIELGFLLSDIVMNMERVSDHCSNIAVSMLQAEEEEFDTHAYLDRLKQEDNIEFRGKVLAYGERYRLP